MRIDRDLLKKSVSLLLEKGFNLVLIGSTVFSLYLKEKAMGDDIDFYAITPDPVLDEEAYYSLADELGWYVGRTWIDTPSVETSDGIKIDFYSNLMEFEFPSQFIDSLKEWRLGNTVFKSVSLEQAILLKVRASLVDERHSQDLKRKAEVLSNKIDYNNLREQLLYFSEDTRAIMGRRLSEIFKKFKY